MNRCNNCGTVLPPNGDCPACFGDTQFTEAATSATAESSKNVRQSITVEGSEIGGGVTNDAVASGKADDSSQSIAVRDSIVDGEIENRRAPERIGTDTLVKAAVEEIETERSELERKISATDNEDQLAVLQLQADDVETLSVLREIEDRLDAGAAVGPGTGGDGQLSPIPVTQMLTALTEVERLAASNDPDVKELYVAIEKVVRLLTELDMPVGEDLASFVERQRVLTEGSIYDETIDDSTRATLQSLCDRARSAVVEGH